MLEHLPARETPRETQDRGGPGLSPGQQPGPYLCPWHPLPNQFLTSVHADVHLQRQREHLSPPGSVGYGPQPQRVHSPHLLFWGGGGAVALYYESLCVISQVAGLCCAQFISAMPFFLFVGLKKCCWQVQDVPK